MMIGFIVIAITLGSLLAAGMPLLTAIIGVLIGTTALTALSGVINVSETAPMLATMLGLAVGIDYALFILSRHRQNLADGHEPREAAALAVATAGSAVVFAGATVVIALVGLLVVGIPFLNVMGLAAAGTVAIAVLIALTLLPALLGFAGTRMTRSATGSSPAARSGRRARAEDGHALGPVRDPAAARGPRNRPRRAAGGRDAGSRHEARPAGRRLAPEGRHRARVVRPAHRGLRPRLQRHPDGRRRRAGAERRGAGADRQADARGRLGVPGRGRGQPSRSRTRPASSPSSR